MIKKRKIAKNGFSYSHLLHCVKISGSKRFFSLDDP